MTRGQCLAMGTEVPIAGTHCCTTMGADVIVVQEWEPRSLLEHIVQWGPCIA
jgi:hypothetical protein